MVNDLPAATGFALLVAGAAAGSGRSLSWLSWKPLDMFGVASYGFYLWHVPILLFLKSQDVLGDSFLVAFAIGFPLATLAGFLSWNLIERPLLDGTNRRIKARRAHPGRWHPAPGGGADAEERRECGAALPSHQPRTRCALVFRAE